MAQRIFRTVVMMAILAVLLSSLLLVPALYSVYETSIAEELRTEADYIVHVLDATDDDLVCLSGFEFESRVTLVAADGAVLYDNAADVSQLQSHAQRPEIEQALTTGSGESKRYSDTLSQTTLYYARRTASGDVLRIANTRNSVLGVFLGILPQILVALVVVGVISLVIARTSARRIVAPINSLNLDAPLENNIYDELAPLMSRIDHQRKELSSQLRSLERAQGELSAIMANMREGLVILDWKSCVLSMNASASKIFGVSAAECTGSSIFSFNRVMELNTIVQAAQNGVGGDLTLGRNGRTYRFYVSPVKRGGRTRGAVLLILDITERFAAEQSRREFSANVSHELKTPLTSISGYAEIIRDGIARPEDVSDFAGKICSETRRMIALVNDILELSRLDEKQGLGEKEQVDLLQLLKGVVEEFQRPAQEKNIEIALDARRLFLQGYPLLLHELFSNLVDNAVKYTPEGGKVRVAACAEGKTIVCCVSDDGPGIPEAHQAHIFERFYRVDKSHSRATGGTGLGLAIVKHAAEVHGAKPELISAPGKGTTICIRFK